MPYISYLKLADSADAPLKMNKYVHNTNMSLPQRLEPCCCKVTSTTYSCNHQATRTILCKDNGAEPVSPTSTEPDHFPLKLKNTKEDLCDECAVMLILAQDTSVAQMAVLGLSEPARHDELVADIPATPQLTYMGSMGQYEQLDFDLPAVSPDMYFNVDWDKSQNTAEIVLSKQEANDDYTLPKLKYDPTAPGCAIEDDFEKYVASKGLLPTRQNSKGKDRAASWQSIMPTADRHDAVFNLHQTPSAVILSKSGLAAIPRPESPDLKRAKPIQQSLRSSSMSSEVSLDLPIQLPCPLRGTEDSSETVTTVITVGQYTPGTDGITRLTGQPDIIRYIVRTESHSEPFPPFTTEPLPNPPRHPARELRYLKMGSPSLIDILPHNRPNNSPQVPSRPTSSMTWLPALRTVETKLDPPARAFRRTEQSAGKIKSTTDPSLKKVRETCFTRRGTVDQRLRPHYPPRRRTSTPPVSPKQVPRLTKATRAAARARAVVRQWAKSTYCSDPPDSHHSHIEERTYENGQYVADVQRPRLSRLIYLYNPRVSKPGPLSALRRRRDRLLYTSTNNPTPSCTEEAEETQRIRSRATTARGVVSDKSRGGWVK